MTITRITFRNFEANLRKILKEYAKPGDTLIVEMPKQRFLAIQSLDIQGLGSLVDELTTKNTQPQSPVAKPKASARKPVLPREA